MATTTKFPHLPDIPIDTKVLVYRGMGSAANCNFISAYFSGWTKNGNMTTFDDGRTSYTRCGISENWVYWKIAEGEHKGKKNFKLGDIVEPMLTGEGYVLVSIEARKILNGE